MSFDDTLRLSRQQTGHPTIWACDYRKHYVELIVGYDIVSDRHLMHVYVTPTGGPRRKVDTAGNGFPTQNAAYNAGEDAIKRAVLGD